MTILPLIPARGWSQGVPGKHLRPLPDGSTLLSRAIAIARAVWGHAVVSTQDRAIAAEATRLSAAVIWRACGDDGPMHHVLRDAMRARPETTVIALVQPTTPLRTAATTAEAWQALSEHDSSVVTISPVPLLEHAQCQFTIQNGHLRPWAGWDGLPTRRQNLEPTWRRNGLLYVFRAAQLAGKTPYGPRARGVVTPCAEDLTIDEEADWAELVARTTAPSSTGGGDGTRS
jgi:N-acylneuraminate cytidylyltransferase